MKKLIIGEVIEISNEIKLSDDLEKINVLVKCDHSYSAKDKKNIEIENYYNISFIGEKNISNFKSAKISKKDVVRIQCVLKGKKVSNKEKKEDFYFLNIQGEKIYPIQPEDSKKITINPDNTLKITGLVYDANEEELFQYNDNENKKKTLILLCKEEYKYKEEIRNRENYFRIEFFNEKVDHLNQMGLSLKDHVTVKIALIGKRLEKGTVFLSLKAFSITKN